MFRGGAGALGLVAACVVSLASAEIVLAQADRPSRSSVDRGSPRAGSKSKTSISVELLMGDPGAAALAQEWAAAFGRIGQSVRIRRPVDEDKPEVKEDVIGTLRRVTVIGGLGKRGEIVFPDRSFQINETDTLKEWLRELETYGAQGAPEGKPLWGMTDQQFAQVFEAVTKAIEADVSQDGLSDAITKLDALPDYRIRVSTDAARRIEANPGVGQPFPETVTGMSLGTGLSLLLNHYELGFRPLRTPDQRIELVIDPLSKIKDPWPVGWDVPAGKVPADVAPKLFELVPVQFDDVPLADVLAAIAVQSQTPIFVDHRAVSAEKIDLAAIRVSQPPRKTSWSLLLQRVVVPAKMARIVRMDESGRPFVWLTTMRQEAEDRKRKARN